MRLLILATFLALLSFSLLYAETQVLFSPVPFTQESIRGQIIKHINLSEKSIDVAIYDFTAEPIAKALLDAKNRGVNIRVIMDKRQINKDYSKYNFLLDNGFKVKVLSRWAEKINQSNAIYYILNLRRKHNSQVTFRVKCADHQPKNENKEEVGSLVFCTLLVKYPSQAT